MLEYDLYSFASRLHAAQRALRDEVARRLWEESKVRRYGSGALLAGADVVPAAGGPF